MIFITASEHGTILTVRDPAGKSKYLGNKYFWFKQLCIFIRLDGKLKHICVSNDTIVGTSPDDDIYTVKHFTFADDGKIKFFVWQQLAGKMKQLSVSKPLHPGTYIRLS